MPAAMLAKLPTKARDIWEATYKQSQEDGKDEETSAKIAWEAVKRAGFRKGDGGKWSKMHLVEMYFTKASIVDGERRWAATVSKFAPDVQADEVTPEFYKYAIHQIDAGRRPTPVLCVSHIDRGKPNDQWVAGDTVELYIDGDLPKAKGTFRDTPLGHAAFATVKEDIKQATPHEERARISMGFFNEESEPRVTKMDDGSELEGQKFKRGWIKHFALTRVPVVAETEIVAADLEVKSMGAKVTQKEDAASIVGDELAEELLQHAKAELDEELIVKAEDEEDDEDEEMEEEEEKEAGEVEEEEEETEDEEEEEEDEEEDEEEKADYEDIKALLGQLLALLDTEFTVDTEVANAAALGSEGTEPPRAGAIERSGPYKERVDEFVGKFAAEARDALLSDADRQNKFSALQELLEGFGEGVTMLVKETPPSSQDIADSMEDALRRVVEPLRSELASVKAELEEVRKKAVAWDVPASPVPQSLDTRARVITVDGAGQPINAPPIATGPQLKSKKWKVADLAYASTKEPGY